MIDQFSDEEFRPWGMELKTYCMLMHLSQFAGYIIPFGGLIMPIVMWTTNKDQSEVIDQHGKNIVNWMISLIIYAVIGGVLAFIIVGIFVLIAVGICSIIFTIMGAVKASNNEIYKYPLTIDFIK